MSYGSLTAALAPQAEPTPLPEVALPPPCDGEAKVRKLLVDAGYAVPAPTGQPVADRAALIAPLWSLLDDQGVDPRTATAQQICDALVQASKDSGGSTWSTGSVAALAVGGIASAVVVTVVIMKGRKTP